MRAWRAKELLTGFGQADTAHAVRMSSRLTASRTTLLKCAYAARLTADEGHPELRGRSTKNVVLSNAQECLYAVESA